MKSYTLCLYEKAMPDLSWKEKLTIAKECGFDAVEISIDETDKKLSRLTSEEDIREIEEAIKATGIPVLTMCLSGHRKYPLGSKDPAVRARSLEIMENAVTLARRLGIRVIQLAGYDVYYEEGDEETRALFGKNLLLAVEMAAKQGVCLGFETMETPFMDTVEKSMAYVNEINSAYLGVYPDIGNLKNAAVKYGGDVNIDLALGKGHILAAHLKETKVGLYRDMLFGQSDGHTEYEKNLKELVSQGVRLFTGEFWYHGEENYLDTIKNASAFLRDKIENALEA